MEALTIAGFVVGLVTRCIKTANEVFNAFEQYGDVPQTLSELVNEIQVVKVSLHLVERFLRDTNAALPMELQDIFPIAIRGCQATLLCLEQEFFTLKEQPDWWARLRTIWKDEIMKRLLENLGRRQLSITLLIQCLNL